MIDENDVRLMEMFTEGNFHDHSKNNKPPERRNRNNAQISYNDKDFEEHKDTKTQTKVNNVWNKKLK